MEKFLEDIKNFFTNAGLNILIGIAILIVGLLVCKIIKVVLRKILRRGKRDEAVISFVVSLVDITIKVIIFISALATMGINTASIIAVLGTCGVAIGLALKDSLGNLASGMLIIFNKPFKQGDYIEVAGVAGTIDAINLFNTTLLTYDGKKIVLPNSAAVNNPIINANGCELRRVDINIALAKGVDIGFVKNIIGEIVEKDERISTETPYAVNMTGQTEDSVNLVLKAYTKPDLYWDVLYELNELIYTAFKANKIERPSRQIEVKIDK